MNMKRAFPAFLVLLMFCLTGCGGETQPACIKAY